ncbi:MAG: RNA polymerase sigma factor [Dethiobacteria bacterium]
MNYIGNGMRWQLPKRIRNTVCHRIAMNILSVHEDAEECVNDTYLCVWNAVPPERPRSFPAYLGRIIRNLSFNRWNKKHAQKRYNGIELLLSSWKIVSHPPKM